MNTQIKELLNEMIQYKKNRKPVKYLHKAFEEMGDQEIIMPISYLLSWHKKFSLGLEDSDKFKADGILNKRYVELFEKCPELKKIFSVHKDHIGWASTLSKEKQDEIRNYIHENFIVQIRIRRDTRLKK